VQRSFGIELAADQDGEGIYIVARRKPVVGSVTRADFTLTVPPDTQLALNLTPGEIVFQNINGLAELDTATFHSSAATTNGDPAPTDR
jgi:hypothetical protein